MDTTTNLKLNKPAPEDFYDVADFNENADKIDSEFIKTLKKKKVTELPSTTKEYTFESSTEFTAVERCTLGLVTEGSDKFLRVTTASNSGNKYALAQLNFADIGQTADSFVINMDIRMPLSRWYVSLVDLSKRPGESDKISYDTAGVALSCGTKDGANFNVNNTDVFGTAFANAWLRIRLAADVTGKTVAYEIKNRSNDTVLASGTVSFRDSGTDKITGIELYSYTQTTIDVDNIKVTAGYEIEENVIYCVGSGEVYDTYVYFDGEPVCLSSQTSTQLLKENSHTHSNKNVLDDISSSDISNWNNKANIASPVFTGTPKAPTPDTSDNSTRIATTAFVLNKIQEILSLSGITTLKSIGINFLWVVGSHGSDAVSCTFQYTNMQNEDITDWYTDVSECSFENTASTTIKALWVGISKYNKSIIKVIAADGTLMDAGSSSLPEGYDFTCVARSLTRPSSYTGLYTLSDGSIVAQDI